MKPVPDGKFTAFIGIDWADSKHDICLQAADSEQREFDRFAHRVDRIEQWACAMRQRFGGPIALALELSKGPLVYALLKYDFFVLFPLPPAQLTGCVAKIGEDRPHIVSLDVGRRSGVYWFSISARDRARSPAKSARAASGQRRVCLPCSAPSPITASA